VRFEVVTAVTVKISVFWDMTPCCMTETYRYFGGTQSIFELKECSENGRHMPENGYLIWDFFL
jgi:hypothetical protein